MNVPNAKTTAAARVQAAVVGENLIADIKRCTPVAQYHGYGGTLLPSFLKVFIDGPTRRLSTTG